MNFSFNKNCIDVLEYLGFEVDYYDDEKIYDIFHPEEFLSFTMRELDKRVELSAEYELTPFGKQNQKKTMDFIERLNKKITSAAFSLTDDNECIAVKLTIQKPFTATEFKCLIDETDEAFLDLMADRKAERFLLVVMECENENSTEQ